MAGYGNPAGGPQPTAAFLVAAMFVAGCISVSSPQTDEPFAAVAELTAPCDYRYPYDNVSALYRSELVFGSAWGSPEEFGLDQLEPAVRRLPDTCPRRDTEPETAASIRAYYLKHTEKISRTAGALAHIALLSTTLGFAPIPKFEWYAVCVEVSAADGLDRRGIATGKAHGLENIWGGGEKRMQNLKEQEALLQQLTVQAWQKAWTGPMAESRSVMDCPNHLEAIRKGEDTAASSDAP